MRETRCMQFVVRKESWKGEVVELKLPIGSAERKVLSLCEE
jgi:hypothetical protein